MLPSTLKKKRLEEFNKPKVHQKISNSFIENVITNKNSSVIKIVYYLSTILKDFDQNKELNTFIIDRSDMLKFTGLKTDTDIKNNLKKMNKTSISFVDESENIEEYISLLPRIKMIYGKRKVEIDIYSKVAKLIIDVVRNYTFIDTNQLMKLHNIHSLRMLPILNMINQYTLPTKKQKKYTLDNLNDIFETNYKSLNKFDLNVLKKAKTELDNNSNLTFSYETNFDVLGTGRPKAVSITIIPIEKKSSKNKKQTASATPAPAANSAEPTEKAIFSGVNDENFKLIFDNVHKLELEKEFDISPLNQLLINKFHIYLQEQVIVFKQFCIDNNKNYKNLAISFKRHIKGAYTNKLDFFASKEYLNRKEDENRINEMKQDQQIKEFLQQFEGKKLCEYKFNFDFDEENLPVDIYVLGAELYVRDKETRGFTPINNRERTIDIINSMKKK